ncbi:MAG TPA: HAD-IA family hydrolase, partial [Acidobacteriota bacterium]|nr:HAD-IA family hydrolase [Acidobacteriota bacterium]
VSAGFGSGRKIRIPMAVTSNGFEVVFLDAAGTLFEVRGSVGEIYSSVAQRHGVTVSPVELQAGFVEAFRRKSHECIPSGNSENQTERERRWWLELVEGVLSGRMPASALPGYFEEVFETFRTTRAWRLFPDTRPGLEMLCKAGYRLGIISNFDSRLEDLLRNLGIAFYFERVIISWTVGSAKPAAGIFCRALDVMGVAAQRAVHVGDSLTEDVVGAQRAGLRGVLLDRNNALCDWRGGCRIRSLEELFTELEKARE